jgi:hypothetical protein
MDSALENLYKNQDLSEAVARFIVLQLKIIKLEIAGILKRVEGKCKTSAKVPINK